MASLRESWEKTRWTAWSHVAPFARRDEFRPVVPQRKEFSKKFVEGIPDGMPQAQWARRELSANSKVNFKDVQH